MGLMGASSTPAMLLLFLGAIEHVLHAMGHKSDCGAAGAAMELLAGGEACSTSNQPPEADTMSGRSDQSA